jgi:hypothetical protein
LEKEVFKQENYEQKIVYSENQKRIGKIEFIEKKKQNISLHYLIFS